MGLLQIIGVSLRALTAVTHLCAASQFTGLFSCNSAAVSAGLRRPYNGKQSAMDIMKFRCLPYSLRAI
jgi:hypothetical protein